MVFANPEEWLTDWKLQATATDVIGEVVLFGGEDFSGSCKTLLKKFCLCTSVDFE